MKLLTSLLIVLLTSTTALADEYYLGQWVWKNDLPDGHWEAPYSDKIVGLVDLRPLPAQGKAGGVPEGYGLFVYKELINDSAMFYLGNGDNEISEKQKNYLEKNLGVSLSAKQLKDALWEVMTTQADPTGQARMKPIMPTSKRDMLLSIGDKVIKQSKLIPYVSPEWDIVLATLQNDYKEIFSENPQLASKVLDYWQEQFDVHYKIFIPSGYPEIIPTTHATTYTDDFNCSDSDTFGCDLTWTEVTGDIDIQSNEAYHNSGGATGRARAEHDVSTSNNYVTITIARLPSNTTNNNIWMFGARGSSSANTYYDVRRDSPDNTTSDLHSLRKVVTGTGTTLSGPTTEQISVPETWTVQANGSTISATLATTQKHSVTDTSISTGTRGFLAAYTYLGNALSADNFEISDVSVATRRIISIQ